MLPRVLPSKACLVDAIFTVLPLSYMQAVWGSAYYSLEQPIHITQVRVDQLNRRWQPHVLDHIMWPSIHCHADQNCHQQGSYISSCQPACLLFLQDHVVELGKISLDCLIIGELDLGRVCHCLGELTVVCRCMFGQPFTCYLGMRLLSSHLPASERYKHAPQC